jgi:hypothetical protein
MTTKAQFIQAQRLLYPTEPIASFVSRLNTPSLVNNPTSQGKIPKQANLTLIINSLADADVLVLNTKYAAIVSAIIENINKGQIADVANLIRSLSASELSQSAKTVINESFQAIAASYQDPATYGDLDPNWQAQLMLSPAQVAGFGTILTSEVVEALQ